jgi:hypothetical protein
MIKNEQGMELWSTKVFLFFNPKTELQTICVRKAYGGCGITNSRRGRLKTSKGDSLNLTV